MNVESVLLRVLYFSNQDADDKESLDNVITTCSDINDEVGIEDLDKVTKDNISSSLSSLENHLLVVSEDDEFSLTEDGVDRAELLMTESEEESRIEDIVN